MLFKKRNKIENNHFLRGMVAQKIIVRRTKGKMDIKTPKRVCYYQVQNNTSTRWYRKYFVQSIILALIHFELHLVATIPYGVLVGKLVSLVLSNGIQHPVLTLNTVCSIRIEYFENYAPVKKEARQDSCKSVFFEFVIDELCFWETSKTNKR